MSGQPHPTLVSIYCLSVCCCCRRVLSVYRCRVNWFWRTHLTAWNTVSVCEGRVTNHCRLTRFNSRWQFDNGEWWFTSLKTQTRSEELLLPFDAHCCHMSTAIEHDPVSDRVKPSLVIFDIRALWCSGLSIRVFVCQKLQMTRTRNVYDETARSLSLFFNIIMVTKYLTG